MQTLIGNLKLAIIRSMPLYRREDSADILAALGKQDITDESFAKLAAELNHAAFWYRSLNGYQDKIPTYKLIERLELIKRAASRVIKHGIALAKARGASHDFTKCEFGQVARAQPYRYRALINSLLKQLTVDPAAIEDGIRDLQLQGFLRRPDEPKPDFPLRPWLMGLATKDDDLTRSLKAAYRIHEHTDHVLEEVQEFKNEFDRAGDTSIAAEAHWIDVMLSIFVKRSGKEIEYYRLPPTHEEEGRPVGDIIDFLIAAAKPVDFPVMFRGLAARIDRAKQIAEEKKQAAQNKK